MPTRAEAIALIRQFRRSSKLTVFRTTTPAAGDDYFVQKLGGPDGLTNGVEIERLRVKFRVERDSGKHPNHCDVEITNLSPRGRAAMETKPLAVEFAAGYAGLNKLLFAGDVLYAWSERKGPHWSTTLQVGDGARAFARARISKTYPAGTTVKAILRDVARRLGQDLPANVEASTDLDAPISTRQVAQGAAHAELTRLLAPYGYEWSFQNGRLQALRPAESRNDVWPVGEHTGMIDSPEFGQASRAGKPPTMTIQHLLYPEITPGGLIELKSDVRSGLFKVVKVEHSGDTEGDDWFTTMEVKPAAGPSGSGAGGFSGGRSRGAGAGSSF